MDSMKHGKGEFKWHDGSSYKGDFEHNDIQGNGKFFISLYSNCM